MSQTLCLNVANLKTWVQVLFEILLYGLGLEYEISQGHYPNRNNYVKGKKDILSIIQKCVESYISTALYTKFSLRSSACILIHEDFSSSYITEISCIISILFSLFESKNLNKCLTLIIIEIKGYLT